VDDVVKEEIKTLFGGIGSHGGRKMWRMTNAGWRQWIMDAACWMLALAGAAVLRYDFSMSKIDVLPTVVLGAFVALAMLLVGIGGWLYQGRYFPGSLEEFRALGWVMVMMSLIAGLICVLAGPALGLPRSLGLLAAPIALAGMLSIRYVRRLTTDRTHQANISAGRRTLIFGAGSLGSMTIQRMLNDTRSAYQPVGFLDDDDNKVNLSIRNVPVLGKLSDLAEVAKDVQASALIVAVADADAKLMSRVMAAASPLDIDVKVMPTLEKSLGGRAKIGPMRDITVEDLIERPPVNLDLESIARYLSHKRVLVTGAGGSIGQELCVQIKKYHPSALVMLDHDETHLQDTEFELWGTGLLTRPEIVLADIRDREALAEVFNKWRPEVVFHAAALKHVPMLQRYPREAWDTNVMGTLNVLECARDVGTDVFVNISTDKAADPTTVLGHSKRLAECLTSWMGEQTGRRYCSVRFGNVFGSRGSAIPLFRKMIDRDIPITVTSEDATRYFMTIPEAAQLVVQAGAKGAAGEVLILDMGQPVKIADIVTRMIQISGKDCDVEITGIRSGEKLHEVLLSTDEQDTASAPHDRTVRAPVPPVSPDALDYDTWIALVDLDEFDDRGLVERGGLYGQDRRWPQSAMRMSPGV